ncbi:hypothetical protein [Synechococcus phage MC09]
MNITNDTIINEWSFEFYSTSEEEWLDFGYWTISDDQSAAIEILLKDEENQVEHLSCNHREWTFEQFKLNQGPDCMQLIRDL